MGKHRPVNKSLAEQCMEKYKKVYKNSSDPAVQKAYTEGLVFDKTELINWLNKIPNPSVKIAFGVYNDDFVAKYPLAKKGRLSAFIFPSDVIPHAGGGPIIAFSAPGGEGDNPPNDPPPSDGDPLNMGDLMP
ncbi:hypothetical protein KXQ82_11725 [Mucilaginibacter sp. HMF5004]|uniref:hypothetical protein n=1 Tax=Mucilaginibacter rivuli TaxID=2857527 RepID=UPI001C5CDF58|nr:hypothetical protein [Mucilaginibacter rivuli]MBW4890394.1 hypothetical protein [Mucilaginibacter rivuli]